MAARKSSSASTVLLFKPQRGGKRPSRGKRARYFYPWAALDQAYFCCGGDGRRYFPTLSLSMLADENFQSQIALLLSQLTNEGFDVSGPEAEYRAMLDAVRTAAKNADALGKWVMAWKMDWTTPAIEYRDKLHHG